MIATHHLTAKRSQRETAPVLAAIELGGTKVNVAVGRPGEPFMARGRIPTREPGPTLGAVRDFFAEQAARLGPMEALGIGAFGPVVINPHDPAHGHLLPNPKPGWSDVDLLAGLAGITAGPVALTTDVGAAGVGEAEAGALRGIACGVYVTIGTGIGAAILVNGRPIPALLHPEIGHLRLAKRESDGNGCTCRFHDSCAEGLLAGPSLAARFGQPLNAFAPNGPEMALAADYTGQLLAAIVLAVSPQRIVLGGGVSQAPGLLGAARGELARALNGYVSHGLDSPDYILPPVLGDDSGLTGALTLAADTLNTRQGAA